MECRTAGNLNLEVEKNTTYEETSGREGLSGKGPPAERHGTGGMTSGANSSDQGHPEGLNVNRKMRKLMYLPFKLLTRYLGILCAHSVMSDSSQLRRL